jgi:hypothetical protein
MKKPQQTAKNHTYSEKRQETRKPQQFTMIALTQGRLLSPLPLC